nr:hypothetical protein [Nostoc sp. ChiQUE02]MDZ8229106.1 hypothetical protein [Nostoc sp. ChiQUE02]
MVQIIASLPWQLHTVVLAHSQERDFAEFFLVSADSMPFYTPEYILVINCLAANYHQKY